MFQTGMNNEKTERARGSLGFRKIWFLCWVAALVIVTLYTGWVFWSRRQENRTLEQEQTEKQREENAQAVEMLGGSRFEIQSFYATPGMITRGERAQICYGVSNAKTVSIAPEVGETWPSANRCIDISPVKDTTYTLTIEDAAGSKKTASLTLRVQ